MNKLLIMLATCAFIVSCAVVPVPLDFMPQIDDIFTPEENKVRVVCGSVPQSAIWIYVGNECDAEEKDWQEVADGGCQAGQKADFLRSRCLYAFDSALSEEICYLQERIYTCEAE